MIITYLFDKISLCETVPKERKQHFMSIMVCLEQILKERKMTSKELCAKVGITEANLSILRSGKAKGVRFSTINKICYYLN